jgi:hypothetical protein
MVIFTQTDQLIQTSPAMARLFSTLLLTLALLVTLEGAAMADDALVVLPTGGVTDGFVLDLDTASAGAADGAQVIDLGRRPLVDSQLGPIAIRDLKILPDDSNLMSDVDGRAVAITDADATFSYAFAPPGDRPRVTSASVTAYAAPGEPARILVTDSNRSMAFVVDPVEETMVWQKSFALPGARATFAQAIALPEKRAAFGVKWASLGLSAIEIYQTHSGQPTDLIARLASADDRQFPPETVVVPEIAELRDLMGLPNGNLLVTTRYAITEMTTQGDVIWTVDIGQTTELRGEFASARLLASGRIAVATYQPGVWTNPHTNHRIHWLSASALEQSEIDIFATSNALSFAPARIESAAGHGGSGTFGYRPGLDTTGAGELSDLELSSELTLSANNLRRGASLWGSASIRNGGADTVNISRAAIELSSGACGSTSGLGDTKILADLAVLELEAAETADLQGQRMLDANFPLGQWCAQVRARDASGGSVELGDPLGFDLLEAGAETGSTVIVRDLGHWTADADDVGLGDASMPAADDGPEPGCACSAPGRSISASWLMLLLVGLLAVTVHARSTTRTRA